MDKKLFLKEKEDLIEELEKEYKLRLEYFNIAKFQLDSAEKALKMANDIPVKLLLEDTRVPKFIKQYYRVPRLDEEYKFKSSTQIFVDLMTSGKITDEFSDVNPINIGFALKSLGFIRKAKSINKKSYYGYHVIQIY